MQNEYRKTRPRVESEKKTTSVKILERGIFFSMYITHATLQNAPKSSSNE